ncbi:MAG: 3-phosphoshikimate 1-carboxyvinyltransferase [Flavobacteriaceae bacterium]|nr:3-phosphoshikimate 1-carboxyvinyltransferase [Flavobacteriaceae bacterium]
MTVWLTHDLDHEIDGSIQVTGSKSESNRLLILKALYPQIKIENLSESDDTQVLQKALQKGWGEIDVHHAGTAMRFLTAYFATRKNLDVLLTGSERMRERPIKLLVEALQDLGAKIDYVHREGFPPLRIFGKELIKAEVKIHAGTSSQYISALMLIAPSLPNGLKIELEGIPTSRPYLNMTAALLRQIGVAVQFSETTIYIPSTRLVEQCKITVESDWSSASYFYSLIALTKSGNVVLSNYKKDSLQGDAALATIYEEFGVRTHFSEEDHTIKLNKVGKPRFETLILDLSNTPDLAQTIAVSCLGLKRSCQLTGLHTLKIKETDRLQALKTELQKLGATVEITEDSLHMTPPEKINANVSIVTYNDHRMAMAFAPLAMKIPICIEDYKVVTKSFPGFWQDLQYLGLDVKFE